MTTPPTPLWGPFPVTETVKITDGDTYWLRLDVGFRHTFLAHIRLDGYDCPELNTGTPYERDQGRRARDAAASWIGNGYGVTVHTRKDPDNFGRWLGTLTRPTDNTAPLGELLHAHDLAVPWPNRWRDHHDTKETR